MQVQAQDQVQAHPVVVELFTSQGCSSCPPADALLAQLADRDDVIPLALHVDYWDYIGWKDRFAMPGFTQRQKGYARAHGEKMIYTPQIIVNGAEDAVGSRPMKVAELIQKHAMHPTPVQLQISRQGGQLIVNAQSDAVMMPCEIHIVRYEPRREVDITRGENAGQRITYTHIVENWQVVGEWDGEDPYQARFPIEGDQPVVVLLQEPRYGRIVAAARLR